MSAEQCRILDASFKFAAKKLGEHFNLPKPDLEQDGPAGEYQPLHTKADGELTEEVFNETEELPTEGNAEIA